MRSDSRPLAPARRPDNDEVALQVHEEIELAGHGADNELRSALGKEDGLGANDAYVHDT